MREVRRSFQETAMHVSCEKDKIPPSQDLEKRQRQRISEDNQQYIDSPVDKVTVSVNEETGKKTCFFIEICRHLCSGGLGFANITCTLPISYWLDQTYLVG